MILLGLLQFCVWIQFCKWAVEAVWKGLVKLSE